MIELKLTEQEYNTLVALIDAGVRASGIQGVKGAAAIVAKLEEVVAKINAQTQGE